MLKVPWGRALGSEVAVEQADEGGEAPCFAHLFDLTSHLVDAPTELVGMPMPSLITTYADRSVADGPGDADLARLTLLKGDQRVAVAIPAREEEGTVGAIVRQIVERLLEPQGLVDELVVVDDGSSDGTAGAARAAGAQVITTAAEGKGQALRVAVQSTDAALLVFLDADVGNFSYRYVTALLEPLLRDDNVVMVKAAYDRPLHGRPHEGGRVLVAGPLLELFWPELAHISQPLAGECAIRRRVFDHVALEDGYAIEIALLLDVAHRYGPRSIGQVSLGERVHRNRPLRELAPQARTVMNAALERTRRDLPSTPP